MSPKDLNVIRKNCIKLSLVTHTGLDYLFGLSIEELKEVFAAVAEEYKKGGKKRGK